MNDTGEGRNSQWRPVQQALVIVQLLRQEPRNRRQLVAAVQERIPEAYTEKTAAARRRSFERDLEHLRYRLGATIEYDRSVGVYRLLDGGPYLGTPFSEEALTGLAFLLETFGDNDSAAQMIEPLLSFLQDVVPDEQLRLLSRYTSTLRVDLRQLDEGEIAAVVWERVRYASRNRHLLRFHYLSPRHEQPEARTHTVEPYGILFKRGHYYLNAYCRRWRNPEGMEGGQKWLAPYRLDHILPESVELLPEIFTPRTRKRRLIPIRYRVAPRLWRGGITRHFTDMTIGEPDEEGWVEVQGKTDSLFTAHQVLLRYGELCVVLEPPELVKVMGRVTQAMSALYQSKRDSDES